MPSAFSWPLLVPCAPSVLRRRLPLALGHMSTVEAKAINASDWPLQHAEVAAVEYKFGSLRVHVTDISSNRTVIALFEDVQAFRVLDERDLQEFWPACSSATGGVFEVNDGGWLSQERQRPGSMLAHIHLQLKEYLVTGQNECVNVLATEVPVVRSMQDVG